VATKLKNLVITKVALVDEGSCSAAHIKLFKRKEGGNNMDFEEFLKRFPADQQAVIRAEIEKAKTTAPGTPGAGTPGAGEKMCPDCGKPLSQCTCKEDMKAKLAKAENERKLAFDQVNNMKKMLGGDPTPNPEDDILKNLDPAIKALIEKSKNQAAAAEAAVKKMKDDADTREALEKAKELSHLGTAEADLAKSLKVLKSKDAEVFEAMFSVLKTADAAIAKGVFVEAGANGEGQVDNLEKAKDAAWANIEKKAEEISKSRTMSKEAAVSTVIKECPELYRQYMATLN
jgi:hypothetical protein